MEGRAGCGDERTQLGLTERVRVLANDLVLFFRVVSLLQIDAVDAVEASHEALLYERCVWVGGVRSAV